MLLELIFTVILQNITDRRTDARTHKIPSSWAPVGAKKYIKMLSEWEWNSKAFSFQRTLKALRKLMKNFVQLVFWDLDLA